MLKIEFSTGNAAFNDMETGEFSKNERAYESVRILKEIVKKIEAGEECGNIRDINGNTVGEWGFTS